MQGKHTGATDAGADHFLPATHFGNDRVLAALHGLRAGRQPAGAPLCPVERLQGPAPSGRQGQCRRRHHHVASAAKTGFAWAVAQGGAGPKDYVPHLRDFVARANGIIFLPRLTWQGPSPLPRPIRSTGSGRRPKASVQPPPAPRRGLHPRPGRGRTVIHPTEPVLARRSAKARGKAVPFPVRANDGMAKIAVACWLSSCNGRFVFLGPNKSLKHTSHQTDWGNIGALHGIADLHP